MQVYVIALGISKKLGSSFDKRDGSRSVIAEEYVEDSSATHNTRQIFMRCTFGEVGDKYSTLIMKGYTLDRPTFLIVIFVWWAVWVSRKRLGFAVASDSVQ
jgi:hypothetical protein